MQFICCMYVSVIAQNRQASSENIEFIENKNQWDAKVLYKAEINGGTLFLEKNCFTFAFKDMKAIDKILAFKHVPIDERPKLTSDDYNIKWHAYKINFLNAKQDVKVSASAPFEGYYNYFTGNDKRKWASKVNSYAAVAYKGLYTNTDLNIYESDSHLKYDIKLHPGADVADIKFQYVGADKVMLSNGNLIVKTSVNEVTELSPEAYQMKGSVKVEIPCKFKLTDNILTFVFPDGYDRKKDVVIDPVLIFSTYSGSTVDNWGFTATFDDRGNVYSGGIAFGTGYPVSVGAYQTTFAGGTGYGGYAGCDIAIIKYDSSGMHRLFATYLGGSGEDLPHSMIIDNANELVIYGTTGSSDFPITAGTFGQTFHGGDSIVYDYVLKFAHGIDIFVAKLSADGTHLLASTYVGGSGNDGLNYPSPLSINYADGARGEVLIDANDNVYVTSTTKSTDFPVTAGAFQTTSGGGQDGVVFKMDATLSHMIWSSYIGGSGTDAAYAMVLDANNNVYVTGGTTSINFPVTSGTLHTSYMGGRSDGFISEISQDGSTLMRSTYYGSPAYDQSYLIEKDKPGNIFVFGQTSDISNIFIYNAAWNKPHGGQFISKITPDLSTLVWSTTFGTGNSCPSSWTSVFGTGYGCPDVSPTAFLVDVCNNIYLSGWGGPVLSGFGGTSGLPISASAFQTTTDNNDYYFLVISEDASTMKYATYFGSPHAYEHVDGGTSRFDRKGLIYQGVCGGCGGYSDFPTTAGAWSNTNNSTNCNNAVIKFDFGLPIVVADFNIPPVGCAPYIVNFQNTSHSTGGSGVNYSWTFGDGGTSTLTNPSHTYTGAGVYNVTLIISDTGSCNSSDTISKQFVILSNSTDTLPPKYICSGSNVQIGLLPQPDTSLTYHWTPPLNLSNDTISNPIANPLISTNYVLVISNGLCTDTILQSVGVGNLTVNAGPDTTICPGSSVILSATSIGGATSYIWSTTSDFHDTLNYPLTNNSASVTPAVPSTYYIQVSNQYCTKIDSVHVNFVILRISPSLLIEPSCAGSCDGQIIVSTSGGTSPYSYIWSTGNTGDTLVNICSGNYYVTVSDSKGCKKMDTLTLNSPDTLKINVTHLNVICYDSCHGAAEASAYGGTPSYTYQWNNGDTGNTAIYLCPGIYYVTATDNHLCKAVDTVVISSSAAIPPSIYTYADNTTIYVPQSTGLHTTVVPGYTYSWSPPTGLNNPDIANPVANPTTTTTYIVTVKDQYGCTLMDTITIYVLEVSCNESDIFVPNAFTPNGDNKNDILYVRSNILKSIYFVIYDRWGEKVFETYDQSTGWNGTFKGKACDPGVFDYYMKATCINDKEFIKKGNITLIR